MRDLGVRNEADGKIPTRTCYRRQSENAGVRPQSMSPAGARLGFPIEVPPMKMASTISSGRIRGRRAQAQATNQRTWEVNVELLSFESESRRELAYKTWVRLFVRSRSYKRAWPDVGMRKEAASSWKDPTGQHGPGPARRPGACRPAHLAVVTGEDVDRWNCILRQGLGAVVGSTSSAGGQARFRAKGCR